MNSKPNAPLPAPYVKEADGQILRPDMMPLGPTVVIQYPNMGAGDRITLLWDGGPANNGHWRAEQVLTSSANECSFTVPFARLRAAEDQDVMARYVLRRSGSAADETSEVATYHVQNYTDLIDIRIYDENGNHLNHGEPGRPTLTVDPDAPWFEVGFADDFDTSLQPGDEVVVWIYGGVVQNDVTRLGTASTSASLLVDDDTPRPVRVRFGRRVVMNNYDSAFLAQVRVVRVSGFIQQEIGGGGIIVGKHQEDLAPVVTPGLTGETLVLDELEDERGLAVSVPAHPAIEDATVRFFLEGTATAVFPGGTGTSVDGWVSRDMLEKHADSGCWLYCVATPLDGSSTVARSPRRLLTIQRSRTPAPFPEYDDTLERPVIDGLTSATLDVPAYANGPLARAPHGTGFSVGNRVDLVFRTLDGPVTWRESADITAENVHEDIVRKVSAGFLHANREKQGWLYYSITNPDGDERFSPPLSTRIGAYKPRFVFAEAAWVTDDLGYVISEINPDVPCVLSIRRVNMPLYEGDELVIVLEGHRPDASMLIHVAIDETSEMRLAITLPTEFIRLNAGNSLTYRASRIAGSFIEHTPWKSVPIQPLDDAGDAPTRIEDIALVDMFVKGSMVTKPDVS